jgi:glyoxalase family protein
MIYNLLWYRQCLSLSINITEALIYYGYFKWLFNFLTRYIQICKLRSEFRMKSGNKKAKLSNDIYGIHHVTAIASNAQRTVDLYTSVLGLRLVKLTVNFDDPGTYHLYFGDELGHPGTILTFFPWSSAPKGYRGTGQVVTTSFLIPEDSVTFWTSKLKHNKIPFKGPAVRFNDESVLTVYDPDGLELELVAHKSAALRTQNVWTEGPIPEEHSIRGFYSSTLSVDGYEYTASVLTNILGFNLIREEGSRCRFQISQKQSSDKENDGANIVDVLCLPYTSRGYVGLGTVHHIAWRTPTDEQQLHLRSKIIQAGLNATPVIDRVYFHSVYFREPGGVLFEIATNPPGFAIDERQQELGTRLMLPKWLEPARKELERTLPPLRLPLQKKEIAK